MEFNQTIIGMISNLNLSTLANIGVAFGTILLAFFTYKLVTASTLQMSL